MEILIGHVTHYYTHLGVAVVDLIEEIKLGDTLLFLGHTTDFSQVLCSIESEHQKLLFAEAGKIVAIKTDEPIRPGDQVYKFLAGEENPEYMNLWKLLGNVVGLIFHTYDPTFDEFSGSSGLGDREIGLLLAALSMDPQTISPELLMVRGAYTSLVTYMAHLHSLAEKGYLLEPEPGEFRFTPMGRAATEKLIADGRMAMVKADPLSLEEGVTAANLLAQLVQASLFNSPPPDTWSIRLAYQLMPEIHPPLPYIEQAISCLFAYRDDAHLAAWQPGGISGIMMESLTLIWRKSARSAIRVFEQLSHRGFELQDYQKAVADLRRKGWLTGPDEELSLTSEGLLFREKVEQDTDHYFFKPWSCLSQQEINELSYLMTQLKDRIIVQR